MNSGTADRRRLLVVGGLGGLVGRAIHAEYGPDWILRSVHRHPRPEESGPGVEVRPGDVASIDDWSPFLEGVDTVVNVAWYRAGSDRRFAPLARGLERLIAAAESADVRRFVHVSVPPAPAELERRLPYLVRKREVDRALEASRLAYTIVRPTMLFAPGDKLATVMLRTIARYGRLPMFGDGQYHVSPLAASDLARILRLEGERGRRGTVTFGGPQRFTYRALADAMFRALNRSPRYLTLSPANGRRLARLLELAGSSRLYAYEVDWLVSDLLGVEPYAGLSPPLTPIEPFLSAEAARLRPAGAT